MFWGHFNKRFLTQAHCCAVWDLKRALVFSICSLVAQAIKASAYNAGDLGLIPGLGRSLEKEMAAHSSIVAWKIPWTEEPGRLQSMGSQRVGHDLATSFSLSLSL